MPEYNYICPNCDKKFTVEKRISEYNPHEQCPVCKIEANRDMATNYCNGNYVAKFTGFYGKHST